MPLAKGTSRKVIQSNIREMIATHHPPKQAEAAAYRMAGQKRVKRKGKGK